MESECISSLLWTPWSARYEMEVTLRGRSLGALTGVSITARASSRQVSRSRSCRLAWQKLRFTKGGESPSQDMDHQSFSLSSRSWRPWKACSTLRTWHSRNLVIKSSGQVPYTGLATTPMSLRVHNVCFAKENDHWFRNGFTDIVVLLNYARPSQSTCAGRVATPLTRITSLL